MIASLKSASLSQAALVALLALWPAQGYGEEAEKPGRCPLSSCSSCPSCCPASKLVEATKGYWKQISECACFVQVQVTERKQAPTVDAKPEAPSAAPQEIVLDAELVKDGPVAIAMGDKGYVLLQRSAEDETLILARPLADASQLPPGVIMVTVEKPTQRIVRKPHWDAAKEPGRLPSSLGEAKADRQLADWQREQTKQSPPWLEAMLESTRKLVEETTHESQKPTGDVIRPEQKPEPTDGAAHKQMSFVPRKSASRPAQEPHRTLFATGASRAEWSTIANRKISCDFKGASLEDVALFFHHTTGMTIHFDVPDDAIAFHVYCRDKTVEETLRLVLGSAGLSYVVIDGELTIDTPSTTRDVMRRLSLPAESFWTP
ncbi:hypothetical protein Pan216_46280 [Planctomycetes bacterium Pan216]|uniref:Secretin/TonB short N-terminal domain-containing protein n=1 Tax=Kolteria novifilia TaxID=2527975 RepID=A0A518B9Y6_9BACT|nr:hypothetical protein Pan216_46280 [Planctomycetes bacterium Pan216]